MAVQERGEVYLRLFHTMWDPEGIKIGHPAGQFGRVQLFMRGAVLVIDRNQTKMLLGQWRRLTHQTGWAAGWTIQRRYTSDHDEQRD